MLPLALGLGLAFVIGLSLGMLGGGGSILTVPVLVYVLGYAAKPAIAMSLPVVGITSLIAAGMHWRRGNVQMRTALVIGVVAMVGAYLGARLSVLMTGAAQLLLLAVVMLAASISMLRDRGVAEETGGGVRPQVLIPIAAAVGVLTGLVGIGGGFLVVPALVVFGRVPMRQAVGTSLLVIAMNAVAGFAGYVGSVSIDYPLLGGFTALAVAGALAGTAVASRVPQLALRRAFAMLLIVMGGWLMYQNRDVLASVADAQASVSSTSNS